MASCKEGESHSACMARITNEKMKFKPYEGAAFRYKGVQCSRACEDPTSDLCNKCKANEEFDMNKGKTMKFHGRMGGPIPDNSHMENSAWNMAQRAKNAAKGAKAAPKKRVSAKAKAKASPKKRVSAKAKAAAKKSSSSSSSSSSSGSSSSSSSGTSSSSSASSSSPSPSPIAKAKRYTVKGKGPISAAAAAIIAAAKLSSSGRSSSSSRRSSRRRSSSRKVYLPVSRAASASPRAAPRLNPYVGSPLRSSEANSGNSAVLGRIQNAMLEHPKLAAKLD